LEAWKRALTALTYVSASWGGSPAILFDFSVQKNYLKVIPQHGKFSGTTRVALPMRSPATQRRWRGRVQVRGRGRGRGRGHDDERVRARSNGGAASALREQRKVLVGKLF
jgi:hypothetical protein